MFAYESVSGLAFYDVTVNYLKYRCRSRLNEFSFTSDYLIFLLKDHIFLRSITASFGEHASLILVEGLNL